VLLLVGVGVPVGDVPACAGTTIVSITGLVQFFGIASDEATTLPTPSSFNRFRRGVLPFCGD
jgi:hypothetical protein